jgi:hypothetical protein
MAAILFGPAKIELGKKQEFELGKKQEFELGVLN